MLSLQDIEVRRDGRSVLALDALRLEAGSFTVILGHNGSGKSTLMNLLARQFPPDRGRIELDGEPLASYRQRNFAQKVAFLPQHLPDVAGLTVRELVRLGRFPGAACWLAGSPRMSTPSTRRCSRPTSPTTPTTWLTACPAVSDSAPGSPCCWPSRRHCCCSTNPPRRSTWPTSTG